MLTKAVSDPAPNVGDTVNYTLTLTNSGPDAASGVVVSDPLPAGLTFIDATASQGIYDAASGRWTVGTVNGGATATLAIAVRVDSPVPTTNVAVASSKTFDPNPINNFGTATLVPQQADLAVTKTVSDPTPNVGDTVTFTVTLTNNGPSDATERDRPGPAPGRADVRRPPPRARAATTPPPGHGPSARWPPGRVPP